MATRTIGTLFGEVRTLVSDKVAAPTFRYSDDELMEAFNGAMAETRAKRPDLFLGFGVRSAIPLYVASTDMNLAFPLDVTVYNAFLYYIAGRCELREDTFTDDGRATVLMNKFVSQLTAVVS